MRKYLNRKLLTNFLIILAVIGVSYSLQSSTRKTSITPIVMCYSDTGLTTLVGVDDNGEEYEEWGFDENVYWKRGYIDGDKILDTSKTEIPATNVVWYYKEIK